MAGKGCWSFLHPVNSVVYLHIPGLSYHVNSSGRNRRNNILLLMYPFVKYKKVIMHCSVRKRHILRNSIILRIHWVQSTKKLILSKVHWSFRRIVLNKVENSKCILTFFWRGIRCISIIFLLQLGIRQSTQAVIKYMYNNLLQCRN